MQEAQLTAAQQELATSKQDTETAKKRASFFQGRTTKLWQAVREGTSLAANAALTNDSLTQALEQHQASLARLRALEASNAVSTVAVCARHCSCACSR